MKINEEVKVFSNNLYHISNDITGEQLCSGKFNEVKKAFEPIWKGGMNIQGIYQVARFESKEDAEKYIHDILNSNSNFIVKKSMTSSDEFIKIPLVDFEISVWVNSRKFSSTGDRALAKIKKALPNVLDDDRNKNEFAIEEWETDASGKIIKRNGQEVQEKLISNTDDTKLVLDISYYIDN